MQMYFIAIVLPKGLDEKVLAYKKWMAEKYNCQVGLKSPAHITLVPPFWMEEAKESQLRNDLEKISVDIVPFILSTNNFSAFKPRTIFIAVKGSPHLNFVKEKIDHHFQFTDYKIKIESRPFHPHITIATRDLYKKDFADAWPQLESKSFEAEFEVAGLSLLKHNGRAWDVVYTAPFTTSF